MPLKGVENFFNIQKNKNFQMQYSRISFIQAMKNCHDEQLFIWSSKSKRTDGRIESTGEQFPQGYGIDFRQEYYMMMIIYEYVDTELIDNSGPKIFE